MEVNTRMTTKINGMLAMFNLLLSARLADWSTDGYKYDETTVL